MIRLVNKEYFQHEWLKSHININYTWGGGEIVEVNNNW
jgi:hypothetical protein